MRPELLEPIHLQARSRIENNLNPMQSLTLNKPYIVTQPSIACISSAKQCQAVNAAAKISHHQRHAVMHPRGPCSAASEIGRAPAWRNFPNAEVAAPDSVCGTYVRLLVERDSFINFWCLPEVLS